MSFYRCNTRNRTLYELPAASVTDERARTRISTSRYRDDEPAGLHGAVYRPNNHMPTDRERSSQLHKLVSMNEKPRRPKTVDLHESEWHHEKKKEPIFGSGAYWFFNVTFPTLVVTIAFGLALNFIVGAIFGSPFHH